MSSSSAAPSSTKAQQTAEAKLPAVIITVACTAWHDLTGPRQYLGVRAVMEETHAYSLLRGERHHSGAGDFTEEAHTHTHTHTHTQA